METKKPWLSWLSSFTIAVAVPIVFIKLAKMFGFKGNYKIFKEKVVVITGASSGIGEALAHAFYKHGAKVVLCARRREELERVRLDLLRKHPTVPVHPPLVMPLDLNNSNSFEEIINKILDITGNIDFLINNGGISCRGSIHDTNNDVFFKVMNVNYFGTLAFTKVVLQHMIKQKEGHIVFMSSLQGLITIPYRAAYAASKHALQAFSDALRAEVAQHNIKVTVVSPAYVRTELSMNALTGSGDVHGKMDATTAQGYSSNYIADKTVAAILQNQNEIVIASFIQRLAVLLRTNLPSLYFFLMELRAKKEHS